MSEALETRSAVASVIEAPPVDQAAPIGVLVGRPAVDESVGEPLWVAYESGDAVLRRSRDLTDVNSAVVYHLRCLRSALTTSLLALRLRTILTSAGDAVLVDPTCTADLAGLDRRLARGGFSVLPTTIAVIDAKAGEILVLGGYGSGSIPFDAVERRPIRKILLADLGEAVGLSVASVLALSRAVLRGGTSNLEQALEAIDHLTATRPSLITLRSQADIARDVRELQL